MGWDGRTSMSKRENHWYLVGATLQTMAAARRGMFRPRLLLLWVLIVFVFIVAWQLLSESSVDPTAISTANSFLMAALLIGVVVRVVWIRVKYRADLRAALQQPTPDRLMGVIDHSMKRARAHPDVDALTAHTKAVGLALYGQTDEAFRVLAAVPWQAKAPMVQAAGLSAESIVELLCRRAPGRALELARRAQALSAVSGGL